MNTLTHSPSTRSWRAVALISALSLALCTLGACGGDDAPPATLNRVRAHLAKEPKSLFPFKWTSGFESQVGELIFQNLVTFDPATGQLTPQLAEALPRGELVTEGAHSGQRAYRFRLREGAHFSDGRPVTARDVVTTYKMAVYPGLWQSSSRGVLRDLVDVAADPADAQAVTLYIDDDNVLQANYYGMLPIVPAHVYDAEGVLDGLTFGQLLTAADPSVLPQGARNFSDEARIEPFGKTLVVGSGPYRLAAWESGRVVRLVRDSAFWAHGVDGLPFAARPDTIEFYPVPDEAAALAMLDNGDLDVMSNVTPAEALRLRQDSARFRLYTPRQYTRTFIYLNTADPRLADADTRRGLAHLLNVRYFLDTAMLGFGEPLDGPYHPAQAMARGTTRPVGYSVDSARVAFTRAGWGDADGDGVLDRQVGGKRQELRLDYLYPSASENSKTLALLYADDAKAAGVAVTPIGKELGALLGDLAQRNFQLVQGAVAGDALPDDPYPMWHTEANSAQGKNRAGFGDAASDAMIDSLLTLGDEGLRQNLYARLARRIVNEQPVIFLIVPQERVVVRAGLEPAITELRPGYYLPGFRRAEATSK